MSRHVFRHEAMATFFEIQVADAEASYAGQAAASAFRELDRLEGELSRYRETSDIARANRLGRGASTRLGPDAFECLLIAADAALATGRAFDPAYASARDGLADGELAFTLDPGTHSLRSKSEKLHLDLGAIGKGYALDRMAETLRDWQIASACLNSGGSTALALAAPSGAEGWPIGVGDEPAARQVMLRETAMSGSGVAVKGEHILDPRTTQPARIQHRTWALAPTAALSDALSTAFFVMAEAEVARFCAAHAGIGAVITTQEGRQRSFGSLETARCSGM